VWCDWSLGPGRVGGEAGRSVHAAVYGDSGPLSLGSPPSL
jgi:hypothetical protein